MKNLYRNIQLISPLNEGYRTYVRNLIELSRARKAANRPSDYVAPPKPIMCQLSKPIEDTLRHWLHSDERHVLSFEFFNGNYWRQSYLELDAVRIEKNGTVKIYEFKTSVNSAYCNTGFRQLFRAKEVLRNTGKKIHTVLIQVTAAHRIVPEYITHAFTPKAWQLKPDLIEDINTAQKSGFMRLAFADVFQYGVQERRISNRFCLEEILKSGEEQYLRQNEQEVERQFKRGFEGASLLFNILQEKRQRASIVQLPANVMRERYRCA